MPTEMDERIAEQAEKHGMTYSQYVRQVLNEHSGTPFECDESVLCVDENGEKPRNEGAA
jgi:hypothetical protein